MLQDQQTHNGYEIIEKFTGISKDEQMKIMEAIRHNNQLLESCERHDFSEEIPHPMGGLRTKWKCTRCGGTVDYSEKKWYELGLTHGLKRMKGGEQFED